MAKKDQTTITPGASGAGAASARVVEPVAAAASTIDPEPLPAPECEQVARLAYSYWQDRGCPEGSPEEDWLRAEAELRQQAAETKA